MPAPVVETARLRLRPWQKADFRPYHAILQHPDVHRHFGPEPMGQEECWRRLLASVGCWQVNGFGTWAVTRKSDEKLIGNAGLFTAWRGLDPEFGEDPEMGWIFAQEVHALEPDFAERRVKRQLRKILLASADVARRVEGIVFIVENQDAVL